MFIEICGGIASGKTTLCESISALGGSAAYENFQKNPFLDSFYKDQKRFSFETEVTFLLQHYHSIKISLKSCPTICDFSLVQDLAYADLNLYGERKTIFYALEKELRVEIGAPDILIYISCPEDVLLERICERNREMERSITLTYLKDLNAALEIRLQDISKNTLLINVDSSKVDFRDALPQLPMFTNLREMLCSYSPKIPE